MPEQPALPTREDALALLQEWVTGAAAPPLPRGRGGDARSGAPPRSRRGAVGVTGLLHDLDYERYPDLETGHPRIAMAELERLGFRPS